MKIKEWIIVYKRPLLIWTFVFLGASFLGFLGGRCIPVENQEPPQKDTIYVGNGNTDSLLLDISNQVREINGKIKEKKPVRRCKTRKDTIRIDASLHIENAH